MQLPKNATPGAGGSIAGRLAARRRLIVAAASAMAALLPAWPGGTALAQFGPTMVSLAPVVEQTDVAAAQTFVGEIRPARHSIVGSAVGGRVVEFLVEEGDRVEKQQPLARLLSRAIEIERDAALAELKLRASELEELENGARPDERLQAEAKMRATEALKEYSQSKLERTRSLAERRAASQDQLQDDASAAEASLQNWLEAKAAYDLVMAGPRQERIDQARARVEAAQQEVNRLEDQLEKHTIYSPFDGYVVAEHTEVGQWISAGELVAEIVELDRVDVEIPVLEKYVPNLALNTPARVEIDALPPGKYYEGKVTAIVPLADSRSRTFPVKVRLDNEFVDDVIPVLKPGMFARVTLPVQSRQSVKMVPKDALVLGGVQPLVYVFEPDAKDAAGKQGTTRRVPVTLGLAYEGLIEVSGPIEVGEQVVVEGNERLQHGQPVMRLPARARQSRRAAGASARGGPASGNLAAPDRASRVPSTQEQ